LSTQLTFIEKTTPSRYRRNAPTVVAIEIPELHAKAYRPDVYDEWINIYRDNGHATLLRMGGTSADHFRRAVREWAESQVS
jgi:hypothetical protein